MSGFSSSSLHSATRRFSPPDRCSIFASHGRQAQRVGGDFDLLLGIAAIRGGEDRFVLRLFGGERVEVSVFFGVGGIDLVELASAR